MELDTATRSRIEAILSSDRVVLFMKGTRQRPQCGFSAQTVGLLDVLLPEYATVDVLADPAIREGIKAYANWPTVPQLYIDRELIGGCDIVTDMFNQGQLQEALGLSPPAATSPKVTIAEGARPMLREALASQPGAALHLRIDARWDLSLNLAPPNDRAVKVNADGIEIHIDPFSADRADGLHLDIEDTLHGQRLRADIPKAPPPVNQIDAKSLSEKLASGEIAHLFDTRPPEERAIASIARARPLDEAAAKEIDALPKDTPLAFHCHSGQRSQAAAERYRLRGFTNLYNLQGGIEAWSLYVDSSVPRY